MSDSHYVRLGGEDDEAIKKKKNRRISFDPSANTNSPKMSRLKSVNAQRYKRGNSLSKEYSDDEEDLDIYVSGDRRRLTGANPFKSTEHLFKDELEGLKEALENDSDWTFQMTTIGLTTPEAANRLTAFGKNELPDNSKSKFKIMWELITQPMALMIWLAAAVEGGISNWPDMSILIAINVLNCSLSFYETVKAGDAVAALKASLRPVATCKRDGAWSNIDASELVPGDLVLLAAGSNIPADCRINHGQIEVDQSGLTGESLPVTMVAGDELNHPKMGSTVIKGEVEATVEHTGLQTVMGQTAALLNGGETLSNLQKILMRIMVVLIAVSLVLSSITFAVGNYRKVKFEDNVGFTVVLIVASIPLAIEIVCTTTLALGSRQLSKEGAIVSRLSSIEDLAGMDMLCSDKTGTLTTNHMELQEEAPAFMPGLTREDIVQYAAMAAKWKEPPRDALDRLVLGSADLDALKDVEQPDYMPFDPTLKRTQADIKLPSGEEFQVTKGAPHVVIALCQNQHTEEEHQRMLTEQLQLAERGIRALMVARTNKEGKWTGVGMLTFLDPARPDSKTTIEEAAFYGVPVKMITGDHLLIAKEMARTLELEGEIQGPQRLPLLNEDGSIPKNLVKRYGRMIRNAGGFAQVFPQHKYLIVHALRGMGFKVGMTGDGVNDAPALKAADVGIAVSGATDAAQLAADIVLTQPGLHTIINGIILSREIFQRIYNFLVYRIAASLQLLLFFFVGVLVFRPNDFTPYPGEDWSQFKEFKMPVLLLMLITLLNDGTLISIGYDNVSASAYPCVWNLKVLFCISIVLGLVACSSSLLLLWAALDANSEDSLFHQIGITSDSEKLKYGQITTMIYLKVSVTDFLTLFSARGGEGFFWSKKPAAILVAAGFFALGLSTALATFWPESTLDKVPIEGLQQENHATLVAFVWGYSLLVWFIQDFIKVMTYKFLRNFNLLGIEDDVHMDDSLLQSQSVLLSKAHLSSSRLVGGGHRRSLSRRSLSSVVKK